MINTPQNKVKTTEPPATEQDFPIVGIGASTGGLNAFKKFLRAIPEDSGMAYVIVQHLDPNYKSILPELLAKVTTLPINVIEDDIHLAPNHIYVIPSNKTLTTFDGVLKLTSKDKVPTSSLIDVFFISLAEVHQSMAVGVVLSGTGRDGTLGLQAIKKFGGITFAQELNGAEADGMPESASDANVVDFVLPVEEIPAKLFEILNQQQSNIDDFGTDEKVLSDKILKLLNQHFSIDFTHYKQTTVQRRIARRLALTNTKSSAEYIELLYHDKAEREALYKDLLIPVTSFFRDTATYKVLMEKILPKIFKGKPNGEPVRIWSAGCSTGQEAFSLAILFYEFLGGKILDRQIQIFASDVSQNAITTARKAVYTSDEVAMLTKFQLSNYFINKKDGEYQIIKPLRDMCVFAEHNFIKDPPFSNIDLVSCRNVLIYMEPYLQTKALSAFHYSLNSKGFLLQGKSETTAHSPELFSAFDSIEKIYTPNPVQKTLIDFTNDHSEIMVEKKQKAQRAEHLQTDFRKVAEGILLKHYTPANVIINEQMEIVFIQGDVSPYLEPSQGKPTFNLMKMAREGLAFELRSTLLKVRSENIPVVKEGIPIESNGTFRNVKLEIVPLLKCVDPYFMIMFSEIETVSNISPEDMVKHVNDDTLSRIEQLEKELALTREDMRSVTEDQEAVSEELQSANEEMLSSNEELQSLNEELESSKEELINSNEELRHVVLELQKKNKHIDALNKYTENILDTIREPFVVITSGFIIKTVNSAFYEKNNIQEHEVEGKNLFEIEDGLFDVTELRRVLEKFNHQRSPVLDDFEFVLTVTEDVKYNMELNATKIISPKNEENLILLSFEDITEFKIAEKHNKDFSEELEIKVKERNRQLELINKQLEQYSHTTSHEFQEPLRKIITFAKLIKKKDEENKHEEVKEYIEKIELASLRMSNLIHDMHNYVSLKHQETQLQKTDLNKVVKEILYDFELLIAEKQAKVSIINKLPEIEAIPFQMNQLFYDLISNALKFSKKDEQPVIKISSFKLTQPQLRMFPALNKKNTYYQIVLEDNGIGFEQKYAKQIFTMFQRLNTAADYPGTGIGLALCKKIVDNYHGHIYAEGRENQSAIFHVILPALQTK